MTNSCPGFATYQVQSNGQVEVNGRLSTFAEGSKNEEILLSVWDKFSGEVSAASRKYDVPVPWILGVITAESGGTVQACSPCAACSASLCESAAGKSCCAFGLMQMIGIVARDYGVTTEQLMRSPSVAIDAGTHLLSDSMERFGFDLPRIAAAYNGGPGVLSKCGKAGSTFGWQTNHDYPLKVVQYANTAVELGVEAKGSGVGSAVLVALAGLGVAGYILHKRMR